MGEKCRGFNYTCRGISVKIAIDLRPLQMGHQDRGIGAYLLNILENLPESNNSSYIFVRYDTSNPIKDYSMVDMGEYREVLMRKKEITKKIIPLISFAANSFFPNYRLLKKLKPDIYFQCDYLLGAPRIRGCKTIVVCHDIIPFIFKKLYLPDWKKYIWFGQMKNKTKIKFILVAIYNSLKYHRGRKLLNRANHIIAVSKNTRNDLVDKLNIEADKISVIYPAASFMEGNGSKKINLAISEIFENKSIPVICYIGGTDKRRQVAELIYAFNLYNARVGDIKLILCGSDFDKNSKRVDYSVKKAIDLSSYQKNLIVLGHVSEVEKRFILEKSTAFVFPTLYEGFGIPVIEAMICGTDVLTYKNSSIPEIAKSYPYYIDRQDGYGIFSSLLSYLSIKNPVKYDDIFIDKIKTQFNWGLSVKEIWSVFETSLKKGVDR